MHILITDETNRRPSADAKFFVYGGLVLPIELLSTLHAEIERIRIDLGYQPGDHLKLDTHARPAHVSFEDSTRAKRRVVDLCRRAGCKFYRPRHRDRGLILRPPTGLIRVEMYKQEYRDLLDHLRNLLLGPEQA